MERVCLNKENVSCLDDVYKLFFEGFNFPEYFGSNLDALYDCLTTGREDRKIVIEDARYLEEVLGRKFNRILLVIRDAMNENPSLKVSFNY